jgi:hypothetical protein
VIQSINSIDERVFFFVLVVMLILIDTFTASPQNSEMVKMLLPAYGGYMAGKARGVAELAVNVTK